MISDWLIFFALWAVGSLLVAAVWSAVLHRWPARRCDAVKVPSVAELTGIAPWYTGDQSSDDYLRSVRGDRPRPTLYDQDAEGAL